MRACLALVPFDDRQSSVLAYTGVIALKFDLKVSGVLVPPSQEIPAYLFDHAGLGVPYIPARDESVNQALRSSILAAWEKTKQESQGFTECKVLDSVNEEGANAIGRCSDLVMTLRPGTLASPGYDLLVRAAIMEGGAPVVVLPPGVEGQAWGTVMVVWNGTLQSSRALRGTMDLIKGFEKVVVLRTRQSDDDMAGTYLAIHGIDAEIVDLGVRNTSARERGRRIAAAAQEQNADMMIMGAYSEGRVGRYLGFGGATEKIMTSSAIPVIFAR
ncbi:MAG: universal stress protein [Rhodospirillales bacterium]|nr:universal stress protein [Rhodospirillales bacterium]